MTTPRDWLGEIDDYTSAKPETDDDEAFEVELFAAAAEGKVRELSFLDTLARIAPWFDARGGFNGGATREQIEQLRALPQVHYLELEPGTLHQIPPWPAETELVAYRIGVDLRGCSDVTVFLTTPQGEPVWAFRDCQFDPNDGNLYAVCDAPLATSTFRSVHVVARIEAVKNGRRETVAIVELRPAE